MLESPAELELTINNSISCPHVSLVVSSSVNRQKLISFLHLLSQIKASKQGRLGYDKDV